MVPGQKRNNRLLIGLGSAVLIAAMLGTAYLVFRNGGKELKRYQASYLELFDTVTSIVGYEESEEVFSQRVQRIHDEMEAYDHLYDIYQEYPESVNLCTVNRHPGETFTVDQRIIDLLLFARDVDEWTGHRVDAMFGSVLSVWHEAREEGMDDPGSAKLPDRGALEAAAAHTGFGFLEIDPEKRTVRLTDPDASLDVGALAKGYAAQRVSELLPEGYLLSVGGNVIATGPKPDGTAWTVGVQDPDADGEAYLQKLSLESGSVVTSGDYQRYYVVDGVRYAHIIDPETLFPGTAWRSVTVVARDSGIADALSTALFLTDREEGQRLLDRFGAEAMWIDGDGKKIMSAGYGAYIKE